MEVEVEVGSGLTRGDEGESAGAAHTAAVGSEVLAFTRYCHYCIANVVWCMWHIGGSGGAGSYIAQ